MLQRHQEEQEISERKCVNRNVNHMTHSKTLIVLLALTHTHQAIHSFNQQVPSQQPKKNMPTNTTQQGSGSTHVNCSALCAESTKIATRRGVDPQKPEFSIQTVEEGVG